MSGMKRALITAVLAVAVLSLAKNGSAQYGTMGAVKVFFNQPLDHLEPGTCLGYGVLDTLYVGAWNFTEPFTGIEFQVDDTGLSDLSDVLLLLDDVAVADAFSGSSAFGISLYWDEPVYATDLVVIHMLQVMWLCDDCGDTPGEQYLIGVEPHPSTAGSYVEATRWPDGTTIVALGLGNAICPKTIGTETTSWGSVKALYR